MKKLLKASVFAVVMALPVVAGAADKGEEKQIKELITTELMSANVDYTGDVGVQMVNGTYNISVPTGTVKGTDKILPPYSFLFKKNGQTGGYSRYNVSLNRLAHVIPELVPIFEQFNVTYADLQYVADFIPALRMAEHEKLTIKNIKVPVDRDANITIDQFSVQADNKVGPANQIQGTEKVIFDNIKASHMFGNLSVKSWEIGVAAPTAIRAVSVNDEELKISELKQYMIFSQVKLESLFFRAAFNLKQTLDVKHKDNDEVDVSIGLDGTDISVDEPKNFPSKIHANVNVTGFTAQQFVDYMLILKELSELQGKGNEAQSKMQELAQKASEAQDALQENMVVTLNEARFTANDYDVIVKGVAYPKKEEATGTLTVVNFDVLAPNPQAIDEKACENLMSQMLNGSLTEKEFETQFHAKCSENKGPLDMLRPYASSAKHTKVNGKDALVFDIQIKSDQLFINSRPYQN